MNDDTYDNHTCHDNCQRIACVLRRELTAVTEQRDEWKAKYIQQNKDLGCEMMDPNGTIWDHAKKVQLELTAMTEQRDRMAELLSDIYNYAKGKKPHDYSKLRESDRIIAAFDAWQEIECKIEELLRTNSTQTEPK